MSREAFPPLMFSGKDYIKLVLFCLYKCLSELPGNHLSLDIPFSEDCYKTFAETLAYPVLTSHPSANGHRSHAVSPVYRAHLPAKVRLGKSTPRELNHRSEFIHWKWNTSQLEKPCKCDSAHWCSVKSSKLLPKIYKGIYISASYFKNPHYSQSLKEKDCNGKCKESCQHVKTLYIMTRTKNQWNGEKEKI